MNICEQKGRLLRNNIILRRVKFIVRKWLIKLWKKLWGMDLDFQGKLWNRRMLLRTLKLWRYKVIVQLKIFKQLKNRCRKKLKNQRNLKKLE